MATPFVISVKHTPPSVVRAGALDPLAAYLHDPRITDLFINGATGMFIDRGNGAQREAQWSASEREVRDLAIALVAAGERHLDDAHPCVDVRLNGGVRVHAVLSPVSVGGTSISIRIPRTNAPSLSGLMQSGMLSPPQHEWLSDAVKQRANFLVSGAAGTGKTTLLAAMLSEAPPTERIVTIEDVQELQLRHPHHVALQARQATAEGSGAISLQQLVTEALRMRPDRLVVGECRGGEVRELLTALNTGHDGGAGTIHANSLTDVAARLEALGHLANLDAATLARQAISAIDFVVHLTRDAAGVRRVGGIGTLQQSDGALIVCRVAAGDTLAAIRQAGGRHAA